MYVVVFPVRQRLHPDCHPKPNGLIDRWLLLLLLFLHLLQTQMFHLVPHWIESSSDNLQGGVWWLDFRLSSSQHSLVFFCFNYHSSFISVFPLFILVTVIFTLLQLFVTNKMAQNSCLHLSSFFAWSFFYVLNDILFNLFRATWIAFRNYWVECSLYKSFETLNPLLNWVLISFISSKNIFWGMCWIRLCEGDGCCLDCLNQLHRKRPVQ